MTAGGPTVEEFSEASSVDDVDMSSFTPHQFFEVDELLAVASLAVVKRSTPHLADDQQGHEGRAIRCHTATHRPGVSRETTAFHVLTPDEGSTSEED